MHGCHTASGDDSHVLYIIFRPTFRRCSSLIVHVCNSVLNSMENLTGF